ncbi:ABC transporter permease [Faecalicatena sp. AGMB00832]|uniref:Autoinducer 2 import system permease protein LsrC n=1 Tax=Faecalicatena faecalis TaxID=2726362 RepID=A0ABS6D2K0_9FIRM|nr:MULTISPECIES: ABC transporter permease [Faecalicatena]MBU3875824.1 ABC transporter permease [Faecalicatena faecalis]MCI6467521.1 ABC transporter permease [Faecalicatena sp.]MDY5619697.1 ABC transporter permease [Lachnospiraceae bacterium]
MKKVKQLLQADLSSVIVPIIVIFAILAATSEGFLSSYNMYSVLQSVPIFVIVGLAQMVVLSLGQMNLAVGSIGVLSSVVFGIAMQKWGLPTVVCIIAACGAGLLQGYLQGIMVTKSGINPFIISLALLSLYKGLALVITSGQPFSQLSEGFKTFGNIKVLNLFPATIFVAVLVGVTMFIVIRYRKLGKKLLACGSNGVAAVYSGVNYDKTVIAGHCLSGVLCAVAAILQVSRFGSVQLSIGDDWMLTSFVVPVLGGTLLSGGKVNVIGTFLGGFLMVLINNAIVLWGVSSYATNAAVGIILLLAYEVDRMRKKMMTNQAKNAVEKEG